MRRTLATVVTAAAAIATVATATPAAAAAKVGPHPFLDYVKPVKAHVATWVDVWWDTQKPVCDAKVWLSGRKVTVDYPANTATYSSFATANTLGAKDKPQRTAFRVTADYGKTTEVPLTAEISYNTCGDNPVEKSKRFEVALTVLKNKA
ncbi:hypothetical protein [Symbioplanes lichenis]|uniref:hypothetical protein n=1 Tax=Symbioplanes lichenis TaxID=1629072 RepID=UPI0027389E4F|nr:hypothetical protein [Actinoplanes lichenis]